MLNRRMVSRALLLSLILGWGAVWGETTVRFRSPKDGDVVAGDTVFRFDVRGRGAGPDRIEVFVDGRLIGTALPPGWTLLWDSPEVLAGGELLAVAMRGEEVLDRATVRTRKVRLHSEVDVRLVQLFPVVRDRRGQFVSGLEASDFVVHEDGQPMVLDRFASEVGSLSLAILLDVSESMTGKLGYVQQASNRLVDRLSPQDEVALYVFNHGFARVVELTRNHRLLKDRIWDIRAAGGTALYDAVIRTIQDARDLPGRKAIFVFSDGQDRMSVADLERVAQVAADSDVIVYAVGAGDDPESLRARKDLVQLASQTGGEAYFITRFQDLDGALDRIIRHLRSQYVMAYVPPDGPAGIRTIAVRTRDARYEVRARSSYYFRPVAGTASAP
jgi:Ca-activated chloride channel homolog